MYSCVKEVTIGSLRDQVTAIHYFGLGFIQLKLGTKYRMHFYTDALPAIIAEEDVHNHRYDFTSHIFHGKFQQELFSITEGNDFLLQDESCKEGVDATGVPRPCGIKSIVRQTLSQGSSYVLCHDVFHRVKATNAITFLERGPVLKEYAQVIRPLTGEKICPFSKKIDEVRLWDIVIIMLAKAQGKVEF